MSDEPTEQPAEPVGPAHCFWCGTRSADGPPLTWSLISIDERGPQLLCEICTRTNLRSIESQLSTDWW